MVGEYVSLSLSCTLRHATTSQILSLIIWIHYVTKHLCEQYHLLALSCTYGQLKGSGTAYMSVL
jgi:hypothetical protein